MGVRIRGAGGGSKEEREIGGKVLVELGKWDAAGCCLSLRHSRDGGNPGLTLRMSAAPPGFPPSRE
jgi:hypothetical protein